MANSEKNSILKALTTSATMSNSCYLASSKISLKPTKKNSNFKFVVNPMLLVIAPSHLFSEFKPA